MLDEYQLEHAKRILERTTHHGLLDASKQSDLEKIRRHVYDDFRSWGLGEVRELVKHYGNPKPPTTKQGALRALADAYAFNRGGGATTYTAKATGHTGQNLGSVTSPTIEGAMQKADRELPPEAMITVRGEYTGDGTYRGPGLGAMVAEKSGAFYGEHGRKWLRENPYGEWREWAQAPGNPRTWLSSDEQFAIEDRGGSFTLYSTEGMGKQHDYWMKKGDYGDFETAKRRAQEHAGEFRRSLGKRNPYSVIDTKKQTRADRNAAIDFLQHDVGAGMSKRRAEDLYSRMEEVEESRSESEALEILSEIAEATMGDPGALEGLWATMTGDSRGMTFSDSGRGEERAALVSADSFASTVLYDMSSARFYLTTKADWVQMVQDAYREGHA